MLIVILDEAHQFLGRIIGECAGRPARSRWWKSTAMKE
jgi:hypothetical protein